MEFWRRADNPWGENVLIGVSWDLMWAAVIGAEGGVEWRLSNGDKFSCAISVYS